MKTLNKKHQITLLIWFLCGILFAQVEDQSGLKNYIHLAQMNNPEIQTLFYQWKAAEDKITVAKSLPNPAISYGYFIENVETAVGPQEHKIAFTQSIPWFNKRNTQGKIQFERSQVLFKKLQSKRLDLTYRVKCLWYDYYYLTQEISNIKQNYGLISSWETVIQQKYISAINSQPDLIKTQIERIQLEDELNSLIEKKYVLLEQFRSLLNVDELDEIIAPDSLMFTQEEFDIEQFTDLAVSENLDLQVAGHERDMRNLQLKRQSQNWYPDFKLGLEYIMTGDKPGSAQSGKDPLVFKFGLDLPIWFNKTRKSVQSAKSNCNASSYKYQTVRNQLAVDIKSTVYELNNTKRRVKLYKEQLIPKSVESLQVTEKAYIADQKDLLSLIDAQRRHLLFTLKYEKALVEYLKSKSKLDTYLGQLRYED